MNIYREREIYEEGMREWYRQMCGHSKHPIHPSAHSCICFLMSSILANTHPFHPVHSAILPCHSIIQPFSYPVIQLFSDSLNSVPKARLTSHGFAIAIMSRFAIVSETDVGVMCMLLLMQSLFQQKPPQSMTLRKIMCLISYLPSKANFWQRIYASRNVLSRDRRHEAVALGHGFLASILRMAEEIKHETPCRELVVNLPRTGNKLQTN